LLAEAARATGLAKGLSQGLRGWRAPLALLDPGKVLLDLAVSIGLGGDCLADIAVVRAQADMFGRVASDSTVSRLADRRANDVDSALVAVRIARARASGGLAAPPARPLMWGWCRWTWTAAWCWRTARGRRPRRRSVPLQLRSPSAAGVRRPHR